MFSQLLLNGRFAFSLSSVASSAQPFGLVLSDPRTRRAVLSIGRLACPSPATRRLDICLLYTSDAADEGLV